jgi:hypothetical protein
MSIYEGLASNSASCILTFYLPSYLRLVVLIVFPSCKIITILHYYYRLTSQVYIKHIKESTTHDPEHVLIRLHQCLPSLSHATLWLFIYLCPVDIAVSLLAEM